MTTTRARRAVGALVTAALTLAGAAVAAPTAVAASSSSDAALRWGFRESFRSYVGSPANRLTAGTRIVPNKPATFDPAAAGTDERRPYVFPVASATEGATTTIRTSGSVTYRFPAHDFVITLGDIKVVTTSKATSVVADLTVVVPQGATHFTPGTFVSNDVTIGTAPASGTKVTRSGEKVTVAATGLTLTPKGADALRSFLPAGSSLDNLTVSRAVTKAPAKVKTTIKRKKISTRAKAKVTVKVTASRTTPSGKVTVTATKGKKKVVRTARLAKGKATVTLPRLAKGTWIVKARYAGSSTVKSAASGRTKLVVR
ncbi:hypothetical protein HF995_04530 [Sanguibacter hominis ATCC BAA-789]|uniref:Bacterial Ig-like domain-containing protein n=1 Tax=Sanguibacter hominis ATCC BAA-789 TaxID=1312740 RepID=A0A9X5F9X0_9MICO|nr:HtaA domain-containing protein [Sanguibacter hominis]NKX92546.1 hypothetical protein [Sanguibacter hominis ATCC BAA-789]